jgi:rubrerythrin
MKDYLHEGIDLENTKIRWSCENCGFGWDDDGFYDSDICPTCGSGYTTHEHIPSK